MPIAPTLQKHLDHWANCIHATSASARKQSYSQFVQALRKLPPREANSVIHYAHKTLKDNPPSAPSAFAIFSLLVGRINTFYERPKYVNLVAGCLQASTTPTNLVEAKMVHATTKNNLKDFLIAAIEQDNAPVVQAISSALSDDHKAILINHILSDNPALLFDRYQIFSSSSLLASQFPLFECQVKYIENFLNQHEKLRQELQSDRTYHASSQQMLHHLFDFESYTQAIQLANWGAIPLMDQTDVLIGCATIGRMKFLEQHAHQLSGNQCTHYLDHINDLIIKAPILQQVMPDWPGLRAQSEKMLILQELSQTPSQSHRRPFKM